VTSLYGEVCLYLSRFAVPIYLVSQNQRPNAALIVRIRLTETELKTLACYSVGLP